MTRHLSGTLKTGAILQQAQNRETWSTEMLPGTPRFQVNSPPGAGRGGVIQRDLSNSYHFLPGLRVPSCGPSPTRGAYIVFCVCVCVCAHSGVSDFLRPHGL